MPLKTPEEYLNSIKTQKYNLYMFGEKIEDWFNHPIIAPTINPVVLTYKLAQEHPDLLTATSHLTGERVNRFTHGGLEGLEEELGVFRRGWSQSQRVHSVL